MTFNSFSKNIHIRIDKIRARRITIVIYQEYLLQCNSTFFNRGGTGAAKLCLQLGVT